MPAETQANRCWAPCPGCPIAAPMRACGRPWSRRCPAASCRLPAPTCRHRRRARRRFPCMLRRAPVPRAPVRPRCGRYHGTRRSWCAFPARRAQLKVLPGPVRRGLAVPGAAADHAAPPLLGGLGSLCGPPGLKTAVRLGQVDAARDEVGIVVTVGRCPVDRSLCRAARPCGHPGSGRSAGNRGLALASSPCPRSSPNGPLLRLQHPRVAFQPVKPVNDPAFAAVQGSAAHAASVPGGSGSRRSPETSASVSPVTEAIRDECQSG